MPTTTTTKDFYQWCIAERTSEVDPRHVEAWMRLEHPTLDGLSRAELEREVDEAAALVHTVETTVSEALAASFGLYGKRTHR